MKQCIVMSKEEHLQAIADFAAKNDITLSTDNMNISYDTNGDICIDTITDAVNITPVGATEEKPKKKRVRRTKAQIEADIKAAEEAKKSTVGDVIEETTDGDTKEEPPTDINTTEPVDDAEALFS